MAKRLDDCPAQNCSAGAGRQSELRPPYYAEIPEASREKIEARTKNGVFDVPILRCTYCGCVYGKFPVRRHIFGWLDNSVTGEKWSDSREL